MQGNSLLTDEERAAATGVKELLGGMEYGHIDPATQRAYKTDTLRTQLIRLGGISPDSPLITSLTVEPMPTKDLTEGDLSWRSRVRYTVVKTPSGWRIGMYPHQSSRAVPVIDFPVSGARAAAAEPARTRFTRYPAGRCGAFFARPYPHSAHRRPAFYGQRGVPAHLPAG